MSNAASVIRTPASLAGKYLTFVLGREGYGVPVLKVREIIRLSAITPVPQMPDYVKGVLNLRGKIIPVTDLRLKFRLAKVEDTERTCIVVVQIATASGPSAVGLIVDAVDEVANLTDADIEPTPDFAGAVTTDYFLGIAKVKNSVKTLLDIEQIVGASAHDGTAP